VKSSFSFGLKELAKPNLTYRLGLLWILLDPFITAGIYGFLIVVVRGNFRGFSILIGVLTLQAMSRAISRNSSLNIANEPFPLMHTPTKSLIISRLSTDLSQAAAMGLAGAILIIPMAAAPTSLAFHLPIVCMGLALFGVCLGIILSPWATVVKDIQKLVSYILLASLFLLAVLYDYDMTSGIHRTVLSFIPHTFGVEWLRHIVSGDPYPFTIIHTVKICSFWLSFLILGIIRIDQNRWRLTTWV
jgi:ABC-type polysaccharide/polyol phosphate export permease